MDEGPINVLPADDDEGFLVSLRELVDRQPELRVVAVARNGLEAIESADTHGPDAAVIDLHMPLLDGVAAIARLRQDHASLCLIALTGDDDPTCAGLYAGRAPTRCSRRARWSAC